MRWTYALCGLLLSACAPTMTAQAPAAPATMQAPVAAPAPPPPAAPLTRVAGEVTSVSPNQIVVRDASGQSTTFAIAPDALVVVGRVIQASDIHPGDFVATANTNNEDGSGTSVELRVFPPGLHLGEGSYPMQAPNTTMTNATVAQVVDVSGGRQLTVTFGANEGNHSAAGTRTITVPASVTIVGQRRGDLSLIHPGAQVRVLGRPDANGALTTGYIYTGENGVAPPGR